MAQGVDVGLDSVEMLMALEAEFGIDIPDQVAHECRTVGDLMHFIALAARQQAQERGLPAPNEAVIRQRVATVIAEELGVPLEQVVPSAHLIRDLAVDG